MTIAAEERAARCEAVIEAVNWFEENPHRVASYVFASNELRTKIIDPHHPQAECFCVLGRVLVEADIQIEPEEITIHGKVSTPGSSTYSSARILAYFKKLKDFLDPLGVTAEEFYAINDADGTHKGKVASFRNLLTKKNIQ